MKIRTTKRGLEIKNQNNKIGGAMVPEQKQPDQCTDQSPEDLNK